MVEDIWRVPEEAVLDSGMRKVVFIDKGNGHFEPKEVKLGAKMDGYYQVLSGLNEGERIASSSVFLLDSESRMSEVMGAMAGMPGMSMEGMAGMPGMEGMKMDSPMKAGPMEKKAGRFDVNSFDPARENQGRRKSSSTEDH